jgi:copper resistance protein C
MKKIVITIIVLLLAMTSNHVFAHSALKESSPKDGQVIKDPLQEITLVYETKIEQTSKFDVTYSNGESVSFENLIIEDDFMKGSFSQPLENGSYNVVWKIVGEDGHIIDGEFSFTVDAPVEEFPNEEQIDEPNDENIEQDVDNQNEHVNVEEPKNIQETEQRTPNYVIPSISIILLLMGAGLFWLLVWRKK